MNRLFDQVDCFSRNRDIKSKLLYKHPDHKDNPEISVIMPIYNNPGMFKKALGSAIDQNTRINYDIVVVDNRPYDGTPDEEQLFIEGLNDPKVIYYRNEDNIGMIGNWNRGIELSDAPYVTYCHNDDLLTDICIERLSQLRDRYGDRVIMSEYNIIDDKDNYILKIDPDGKKGIFKKKKDFEYKKFDIFLNSAGFGVGCLFKREHLLSLGGFNEEYYPSADYALFAKYVFEYGGIYNCIPTFCYRKAVNESNTAYVNFAERDVFFRECMLEHMIIPKSIGRMIIDANYHYSKELHKVVWGGKDKYERRNIPLQKFILLRFCNRLNSIRRYTMF